MGVLRVDPSSSVPIFRQIADGLRAAIAAGVYRPGELVPSVRQQAIGLLVNPNTVQRAYDELERDGLLVSQKGIGMKVAAGAATSAARDVRRRRPGRPRRRHHRRARRRPKPRCDRRPLRRRLAIRSNETRQPVTDDFAIDLDHVTKRFGRQTAVDDVTFQIPRGSLCGLVGLNGAGKSTTIRLAVGLLRPTAGTVRVAGCDVIRDHVELCRRVGYVPDRPTVYGWMRVGEAIAFVRTFHATWNQTKCDDLVRRLRLPPDRTRVEALEGTGGEAATAAGRLSRPRGADPR